MPHGGLEAAGVAHLSFGPARGRLGAPSSWSLVGLREACVEDAWNAWEIHLVADLHIFCFLKPGLATALVDKLLIPCGLLFIASPGLINRPGAPVGEFEGQLRHCRHP